MNRPTFFDRIQEATILRLFPSRVKPNHITMTRFLMVPIVVLFIYWENYIVGAPLFIIAAITDTIDGAMARTRNQVTDWGKIYDPVADKLLVCLTAIVFVPKFLSFNIVFLIILSEILIIGGAYWLRSKKSEISANFWGKTKMVLQSSAMAILLLFAIFPAGIVLLSVAHYMFYASVIFAVTSLVFKGA